MAYVPILFKEGYRSKKHERPILHDTWIAALTLELLLNEPPVVGVVYQYGNLIAKVHSISCNIDQDNDDSWLVECHPDRAPIFLGNEEGWRFADDQHVEKEMSGFE